MNRGVTEAMLEAAKLAYLRSINGEHMAEMVDPWLRTALHSALTAALAAEPGAAEGKAERVFANPCIQKLQDDEPFFVLLGRDKHAAEATRAWATYREAERGVSPKTVEAREIADAMDSYAAAPHQSGESGK